VLVCEEREALEVDMAGTEERAMPADGPLWLVDGCWE
jgi:hypothetical protein